MNSAPVEGGRSFKRAPLLRLGKSNSTLLQESRRQARFPLQKREGIEKVEDDDRDSRQVRNENSQLNDWSRSRAGYLLVSYGSFWQSKDSSPEVALSSAMGFGHSFASTDGVQGTKSGELQDGFPVVAAGTGIADMRTEEVTHPCPGFWPRGKGRRQGREAC